MTTCTSLSHAGSNEIEWVLERALGLGVGCVLTYDNALVEPRRNLSQAVFDVPERRVFLLLQTAQAPSEQEWQGWYELLREQSEAHQWNLARLGNLVVTDGGMPTLTQRTKINNLVAQSTSPPSVALVTTSPALRGIARAFTVFNPRFKVFSPDDFLAAVSFVGAAGSERAIIAALDRMERDELGSGAVDTLKRVRRFAR